MSTPPHQEVLEYIREYLKYYELYATLDQLQALTSQTASSSALMQPITLPALSKPSKLVQLLKPQSGRQKPEQLLHEKNKVTAKKYNDVLQAGRQIFSLSINLLQVIHNAKEGGSKLDSIDGVVESYKIQLGKHHKTIISEGRIEGAELISDKVIKDHKAKLEKFHREKNVDGVVEILLSMRVNALQIAPQLRKSLVDELIRRDIFRISEGESFEFIMDILKIKHKSLRHAVTSLISVLVSTIRGIEYITQGGNDCVVTKIIQILKEQQNGNVTQRFCLAILQKCSIKDKLIKAYLDADLISWAFTLIKRAHPTKIHVFCLDFATATLANIVHSKSCQAAMEKKPELAAFIMENILRCIKEPLESSVQMHLLITLSYVCREKFRQQMDETQVTKKIGEFRQLYERPSNNEGKGSRKIIREVGRSVSIGLYDCLDLLVQTTMDLFRPLYLYSHFPQIP